MDIYKDGFKPFQTVVQRETTVSDLHSQVVEQAPSRVRQSVVSSVVRARGNHKTNFQPLLTRNPLQRQYLGGHSRTSKLPDRTMLEGPDYDFREINKVLSMDGFAARAMRTLISTTLKGHGGPGFRFESKNERAKEHVRQRLEEMTFAVDCTGSVPNLLRKLLVSFITKSNVILWIQRKKRGKSNKNYMWQGRRHNEMWALEVIDPSMVDVARSTDTNDVKGFRLRTGGTDEVITFSDCYLLKWEDMRQDNLFAQPLIAPVLDDILVLRRIEEIHELALGKATFPMVHVAIGDPKRDPKVFGVTPIDNEIDRTKQVLEDQAPEGFLVTPYYYDVKIIQPTNMADFLPYMEYYRDRIITGLNMDGPSMGLGNTSNRNTAAAMSEQLLEKVRDIRAAFSEEFNRTIVREILWEGGFMPIGDTAVYLTWDDPDPTAIAARENQWMAEYTNGAITLTELRQLMRRRPLTAQEEKDLFHFRSAKAKESFNTTTVQPENQHGKSASKPKASARKDVAEASITNAMNRAYHAYKTSPASASTVFNSHFSIIEQELSRYISRDVVVPKIKSLTTRLVDTVRKASNDKEIAFAFDKIRTNLSVFLDEEFEKQLEDTKEIIDTFEYLKG